MTAHSEKELAAGNYSGYGFHPLMSYADGPARR